MKKTLLWFVELCLWKIRYLMLFPIIFVFFSMLYLIVLMGSRFFEAVLMIDQLLDSPFEILSLLIDVIDFSLLCVIGLIIIRWLYEIFLNRLEIQSKDQLQADQVLIHDIDELKQKLGKVIIISLIVHVFKQIILFTVQDRIDIIALGLVVALLALALYLLERMGHCHHAHHTQHTQHTHHTYEKLSPSMDKTLQ